MDTTKKVLIGTGIAAVVGVGGFVAFRSVVRNEARKVLIDQYRMDKAFTGLEVLESASGKNWNLPTFEEFLEAITPTWSLVMPEGAINDVIRNGRESAYWPDQYRQPTNKTTEGIIFAALRGATESEGDLITDVLKSAAGSVQQYIQSL